MALYRDEAVVLRTWKLGEADRIVSLHTLGHGKVRAVAKGVRRTRSKFGARVEPACHVAVQLYRGRGDLDTLTQAETIDRFTGLRCDPARFAQASAMLEAVDQLAPEAGSDPDRHTMLVRALATLDRIDSGSEAELAGERDRSLQARPWPERPVSAANKSGSDAPSRPSSTGSPRWPVSAANKSGSDADETEKGLTHSRSRLVVAGFFLKLLALEGVQPELESCVACGAGEPFEALDIAAGGVLCRRCRQGRPLSPEALEMLRQILGGRLGAVLRESAGAAAEEVASIATAAVEAHLERRLRSVTVLERS